jgi:hypothetical protein
MKRGVMTGLALLAGLWLSGCAYSVHLNHTSDFDQGVDLEQAEVVESLGEQFVILGMTTQTDYADEAFEDLQARCPGGRVTGIQTRYSTSLGFYSWTNKVVMRGYCVR